MPTHEESVKRINTFADSIITMTGMLQNRINDGKAPPHFAIKDLIEAFNIADEAIGEIYFQFEELQL